MKRYIQSSVILLAAIALTGCAKTEQFQCNPDSALQIESVSGISPFSLMQEPASKAVITGESIPSDEAAKGIGLFVTATGGGAYDGKTEGYSNVKFTYSSEKWSAASPVYLSNTTGKLYGYFPYSTGATNITSISVASSLNGTDYLYATPQEVSFSNKSVSLQMNHALARLHLTIKKGDKYLSDCNLSKIELQSKAIDASGKMDITTGTVTAAKGADETGTVTLTGSDAVTSTGITKDILLVPADNTEGKKNLTLILTIDGAEAKVNFTGGSGLDIRSGIQCNASIEIQDTGIKVIGVGVGTWGDGGSQTVQVSGHKVTVKLDEEVEDIEKDVWVMAYAQDGNAVIKSFSSSGKTITCQLDDDTMAMVNPFSDENISVFKLSDVSEDIIATIGVLGEGGRKEVTVNGHKVKVVYDEVEDIEMDVWAAAYVKGSDVIIRAISFQGKRLVCSVGDNANCERTVIDGKFTFTISEISSDIDAVLGYAPTYALTVTSDSNGKVWIGDDETKTSGQFEAGQQVVIHATANENFRLFRWNDNNRETSRTITVGENDAEYFANFISSNLIPGLFTVNSNKKQVFFSKGNLYYNSSTFNFEANQYDTTPSSDGARVENHISHFMWCDDATKAKTLKFNDGWYGENKSFFAAKNFTVNGYSGWSVLTGGDGGEWEYLLNRRETAYGTNRRYAAVKVIGMAGLLIFPDDFSSWPSGAGDEPQTFNTNSSNWNGKDYTVSEFNVLENNGCVFLPAAGSRNGEPDYTYSARVSLVGNTGYYWSASPNGNGRAYDLDFGSDTVTPSSSLYRNQAHSVRLVTEVQ